MSLLGAAVVASPVALRHDRAVNLPRVVAVAVAGAALVGAAASASSSTGASGLIYISYGSAATQAVSPDGASVVDAFPAGFTQFAFTPSGTDVAYYQGGTIFSGPGDGRRSAVAGPPPKGVYSAGWPSPSPDATRIAYSGSDFTGHPSIGVMSTNGSEGTALTASVAGTFDMYPEWSPTSDTVLFTRQTGNHVALETVDANGSGNRKELTGLDVQSWQGSWSPDGSHVVYVESIRGGWHIATMRLDGSDHRVLTADNPNGQSVSHPVWSPDGTQIAFVGGERSVELVGTDGSNLHTIAFAGQTIQRLAWRKTTPALTVTTQYVLDNVLLARNPVQVNFEVRSIGGMAVTDATVALHATNASVVSASVGTCRLTLATACAVGELAGDGEVDIEVTFRPRVAGRVSIGLSASSPSETDTQSDNTSTLTSTVSRCTIEGTDAHDSLRASRAGADYICALDGNDTIDARNGKADTIDGGRGLDTARVDEFDKVIHVERVKRS